jgi:hypothetical protein
MGGGMGSMQEICQASEETVVKTIDAIAFRTDL